MTTTREMAIYLHDTFCTHNHTDYCGWHYEIQNNRHKWDMHTHKRYLEKAEKMVSHFNLPVLKN